MKHYQAAARSGALLTDTQVIALLRDRWEMVSAWLADHDMQIVSAPPRG